MRISRQALRGTLKPRTAPQRRPVLGVPGVVAGERDLEVDLDPPAAHPDLLDDQAQEGLAGIEVELVERCGDALGEAREALAEAVLASHRFTTARSWPLPLQMCATHVEIGAFSG